MNSIHECQFTECECEWEWAFSRYFRTECECECELKNFKTTHSSHQFSQNLSKTSFILCLFLRAEITLNESTYSAETFTANRIASQIS
jgi:hypothetical protein